MKKWIGGIIFACMMVICAMCVQVKAADADAPSNVHIVQIANDAPDVYWDAPSSGTVRYYKIYKNWYTDTLDHEYTSVAATNLSADVTHYLCTGVTKGYYLWVAAVMSDGTERVSDSVEFQALGYGKYISMGYGTAFINDQPITVKDKLNEKVYLTAFDEVIPSNEITVISKMAADGKSADLTIYSFYNRGSISLRVYFYDEPVEMNYNTSEGVFEISTPEQLSVFANIVNGMATRGTDYLLDYAGPVNKSAKLTKDINVSDRIVSFCGVTDTVLMLNGHTLTGSGNYIVNLLNSDMTIRGDGSVLSDHGKSIYNINGGTVSLQNHEIGYVDDYHYAAGETAINISDGDLNLDGIKMDVYSHYVVFAEDDGTVNLTVRNCDIRNNNSHNSNAIYLTGDGTAKFYDSLILACSGPAIYAKDRIEIYSGSYFGYYQKRWTSVYTPAIFVIGDFKMTGGSIYGSGIGVQAFSNVDISGGTITAKCSCGYDYYCIALLLRHGFCTGYCRYTVNITGGYFFADCSEANYNYAVACWNGSNMNQGFNESGHALNSILSDGNILSGTLNADGNVITSAISYAGNQTATVKHFVMTEDKTYSLVPTEVEQIRLDGSVFYAPRDLAREDYDSTRIRSVLGGWNCIVRDLQTCFGYDHMTVNGVEFTGGTVPANAEICIYYQWEKYIVNLYDTGLDGTSKTFIKSVEVWADDFVTFPTDAELKAMGFGANGYRSYWEYFDKGFHGIWQNQDALCSWQPAPYSIKYVLDGGKNSTSNRTSYTNQTETFSLYAATKTGYQFDGWYKESSFINKITEITQGTSDDLTLYAKWIPNVYHMVFNGNGATSGSTATQACNYGTSYSLNANGFTKTGYLFKGWNTKADGTGTTYANKASITNLTTTNGKNITLYAQWTAIAYSIKFDGNGATSGTMSLLASRKYGTAYTLTANAFKRTGYTFKGWNTKADGTGTAYANKASVKNLSKTNNSTVILYAQWTPYTYTIKFNGNGATSGTMSALTGRKYGTTYTLPAVGYKKTGYYLASWNTKANGSGITYKDKASVKNLTSTNGATVTLYAQWKIVTYSIAFDGNGSTGGKMSTLTSRKYGTAYTLTANAFTRKGYDFTGWNTKADGSGTKYANKASVKNLTSTNGKTITLYAQWKPHTYTIKFDKNGATSGTMSALTGRKYGTSYTLTANAFKKTNYAFMGWNTKKDGSGKTYANKASVKNLTATNGATVTLYAQWKVITYTVKFDGNGATSGSMASMTGRKYGTAYTLTANAFKRTGYTFAGWNTKKDGTGKAYANKASIKNLTTTPGATVTLYAQWTPITYRIQFVGGEDTLGDMTDMECTYGQTYSLMPNQFEREGYTFVGWAENEDGSGMQFEDGAEVLNLVKTAGKCKILYAIWEEISPVEE